MWLTADDILARVAEYLEQHSEATVTAAMGQTVTGQSFSPETMVETVAALQEGIFAVDPHLRMRQRVAPVRILTIFDRCSMPLTRREAVYAAIRARARLAHGSMQ